MTLGTLLAKELERTVQITENGKIRRITLKEAAVKRLVGNLLAGDIRTMKLMLDYFGNPEETAYDPNQKAKDDEYFQSMVDVLDELARYKVAEADKTSRYKAAETDKN